MYTVYIDRCGRGYEAWFMDCEGTKQRKFSFDLAAVKSWARRMLDGYGVEFIMVNG